MTSLNIEIYSDLICPWCFIGRRKLEAGIKLLDASEPPNILWRPFELNPEMPKAGLDRKTYRSAKFGSLERSQLMDRNVTATGKTLGLEFNYNRVLVTPNTFAGHRLLWWARDKGSEDILADALFRAYFTEGLDIGKNEVLAEVATDAGFSKEDAKHFLESDYGREEVLEEEREGFRRGLNGVPFFVINGIPAFSGAQRPDIFVETFRQVLGAEARRCGSESCSV
ncbi:MAG TPA: DsbA family oxidoreductase [Chthoniobacterales bacterium]|nr:DsbA family oxidoreductase [Chthoniobacterales bacterium]